ncbi:hypothetical protein ABZX66_18430 [Micromonospora aurantiaca]|uniref:hypothetical protein n=1 Tax=Micromonospora aurantiaca (nom. illeg.) TaxID=47850 RepID=UPI0033B06483
MTSKYHFETPVDVETLQEVTKALNFFVGRVGVHRSDSDGFTLTAPEGIAEQDFRDAVKHFLKGKRPLRERVIADDPGKVEVSCELPSSDRIEVTSGSFLQGPRWRAAMDSTEDRVRRSFAEQFGAIRLRVPSVISRQVLVSAGYYRKFPNLVNAISRIRNDYWDGVAVSQLRPGQSEALASYYVPSGDVLNPVTCYHVYSQAQQLLERYDGATLFAVEGSVFRHESYNHGPTRLAEFTMHEMVRMGPERQAQEDFERFLEAFVRFFGDLGVPYRIVSAADAFFGDEPTLSRGAQLLSGAKYEVRVPLGRDELSVASVNLHGPVFADAFRLDRLGPIEATCCAGIGIDRLVYALQAYGLCAGDSVKAAL